MKKNSYKSVIQSLGFSASTTAMISRAMINRFLDFVLCGRAMCLEGCGRIAKNLQDDDAELWRDLTCTVPNPRPPPVPTIVQFPCATGGHVEEDDDVSTLYVCNDPSLLKGEVGETDDSVMHRVAIIEEQDDHPMNPNPYSNNHHGISTRLFNLDEDGWGDGSSYSSGFKHIHVPRTSLLQTHSWHTDSTDTTVQTQNHSYLAMQRNELACH